MTRTNTWKRTELAVAKRVGSKRTGPMGRNLPDVITEHFSYECKHRKTLPAWLTEAVEQARRNCQSDTLPVVVLHCHGKRHGENLVVLTFDEWAVLVGEEPEEKETT